MGPPRRGRAHPLRRQRSRLLAWLLLACVAALAQPRGASAGTPSYCSPSGTPLQAPVVEGGSFGFSVSVDSAASTIAVGQPDAEDGDGLLYSYNQVKLCAYQSYGLPAPPTPSGTAGGDPPGFLGMITALSRDGKWLAAAGTLEADGTMVQVYIYRRPSNDSTGGFVFHQKLPLQGAPSSNATGAPGGAYAGSLSISRDGKVVLASWSVYGPGLDSGSDDPYGAPSMSAPGTAQLYRRNDAVAGSRYGRAQADLVRAAPAYARTQYFGANSYVVADGTILAASTRVVDAARPGVGAPAIVVYRRLTTGAFAYVATLKTPSSDGTFVMTESGSHMAVVQGKDVYVYVFEGSLSTGKFLYNKRCTLDGSDMSLQASEGAGCRWAQQREGYSRAAGVWQDAGGTQLLGAPAAAGSILGHKPPPPLPRVPPSILSTTDSTKLAMTVSSSTLRLAVSNAADTVFVWSIPLGGSRAYSDGTCPASLDGTITGTSGTNFGAALSISENGRTLVIGAAGSSVDPSTASVVVADISLPKPSPSPAAAAAPATAASAVSSQAGSVFDSSYYQTNPSTVLVSARRGTVGVPAPQPFSLSSWASGSPGGAPYSASSGYTISPSDPYLSGGTPVQTSIVAVTSALKGLGLTTAALKTVASNFASGR
jgi:hypothetical protein